MSGSTIITIFVDRVVLYGNCEIYLDISTLNSKTEYWIFMSENTDWIGHFEFLAFVMNCLQHIRRDSVLVFSRCKITSTDIVYMSKWRESTRNVSMVIYTNITDIIDITNRSWSGLNVSWAWPWFVNSCAMTINEIKPSKFDQATLTFKTVSNCKILVHAKWQ